MKLKFNKRKFFHFGKNRKCISIEVAGFDSTPSISLSVDGGERDFSIHIGFGIGIWLTFTDLLPKSWYPSYETKEYGNLPTEKEISLRFHHWSLWWCLWKDDSSWKSTDNKWQSNNINFERLLKGKHTCKWEELEKDIFTISMIEGNYSTESVKKLRIDSWQRWFTKKSISYEVKSGYYEANEFIECPIPIQGKGENSWDCGENARYSSSFPSTIIKPEIKNCLQACLHFEQGVKLDRVRYGGKNWIPKSHKDRDVSNIKLQKA